MKKVKFFATVFCAILMAGSLALAACDVKTNDRVNSPEEWATAFDNFFKFFGENDNYTMNVTMSAQKGSTSSAIEVLLQAAKEKGYAKFEITTKQNKTTVTQKEESYYSLVTENGKVVCYDYEKDEEDNWTKTIDEDGDPLKVMSDTITSLISYYGDVEFFGELEESYEKFEYSSKDKGYVLEEAKTFAGEPVIFKAVITIANSTVVGVKVTMGDALEMSLSITNINKTRVNLPKATLISDSASADPRDSEEGSQEGTTDPHDPEEAPQEETLALTLSDDKQYYVVSGVGDIKNTEVIIPSSYKEKPVKAIGASAFANCNSLTSIVIPDGVTMIGSRAFSGCEELTDIVIPESVAEIGENAFEECAKLKSVTMGNGVTSIGKNAFKECGSLADVYFDGVEWQWKAVETGVGAIPEQAQIHLKAESRGLEFRLSENGEYYIVAGIGTCQDADLVIPSTYNGLPVRYISGWVFYQNKIITSVILPDGLAAIYGNAFHECSNLKRVCIPDSVTSIEEYVFEDCKKLKSVTMGNGITSIGDGAFRNCVDLEIVTFGDKLGSIGKNAFYTCDSVTELVFPESVTSIKDYAFDSCDSLKRVTFLGGGSWIGKSAFANDKNISYIDYRGTMKQWLRINHGDNGTGDYTCLHLWTSGALYIDNVLVTKETRLVIPDGVTGLSGNAFMYCDDLTEIILPDSVKDISRNAFYKCSSLRSIYFTGTQAKWEEVRKDSNSIPQNVQVYFNYNP